MSELKPATKVCYFLSLLFQENFNLEQIDFEHFELFEPSFNPLTDYYSKEMGDNLKRVILFSNKKEFRDELVSKKLWADKLEHQFSIDGKRRVNIDVGYISLEQVVLATGKPYSHRIYLGKGVYTDLVFTFQNKSYQTLPWTYPDYADEEKVLKFNQVRQTVLI